MRYVRTGSGPPVVLLHGFASSLYTWKDVLPALAASHDVVAIDLPGFGGSSIPRPLQGASYPGVVLAVMDHLGLRRASLVGNSLGGSVAVAVAAEHPERVDRLVLIDSAGFNFAAGDRPWILRLLAAPGVAALAERLPVRRRLVAAGLRQVFFDDALVTEERIDEYAAPMLRPGAARAAAELLSAPGPPDFAALLARVRAPTLVVWGREDTLDPGGPCPPLRGVDLGAPEVSSSRAAATCRRRSSRPRSRRRYGSSWPPAPGTDYLRSRSSDLSRSRALDVTELSGCSWIRVRSTPRAALLLVPGHVEPGQDEQHLGVVLGDGADARGLP